MLTRSAIAASAALLAPHLANAQGTKRVVCWSEGTAPKKIHPNDINTAIADGLRKHLTGWDISTASINDPDQGLPEDRLNNVDVLIWWGHQRHGDVKDELVDRIEKRVKEGGMGFLPTHSAHFSKPMKRLMGTNCGWTGGYIDDGSTVKVIVKEPSHPIARGISDFTIPHTERYGEKFEVPTPEDVIFDGRYGLPNGTFDESRQGLIWRVGHGRVFYFQPGHEGYPIYFQEQVQRILSNGVGWLGRSS